MCCICFKRVEQSELVVLEDGSKEDVCKTCEPMTKEPKEQSPDETS